MAFTYEAAVAELYGTPTKSTVGANGETVATSPGIDIGGGRKIIDGDTEVDENGKVIRYKGAETNEVGKTVTDAEGNILKVQMDEPGGLAAKAATAILRQGGPQVQTTETDAYGRSVGVPLDAQGNSVPKILAEAGLSTSHAAFPSLETEEARYTNVIRGLSAAGESWRDPRIETQRKQAEAERQYNPTPTTAQLPDNHRNTKGTVERAALRGLDMVSSMSGGFVEAVGEATGVEMAAEYGRKVRELNEAQMGINSARMPSAFDIEDAGDAGTWALEKIIENAPNMGVAAGAGMLAMGAAGLIGAPIAAAGIAGTILGSYVLNAGEIQGNIKHIDPTADAGATALAFGVPAALLDAAPILRAGKMIMEPMKDAGLKAVSKAIGKGGVRGFASEAPTEAAQEFNSDLAAKMLFGDRYDVFTVENAKKWADAGLAGGISGGGMGVAAKSLGVARSKILGDPVDPNAPAAVVPPVPPVVNPPAVNPPVVPPVPVVNPPAVNPPAVNPPAVNPPAGPAVPPTVNPLTGSADPNATVPEPVAQLDAQLQNLLDPSTGADTMSVLATPENESWVLTALGQHSGLDFEVVGQDGHDVEPTIVISSNKTVLDEAKKDGRNITKAKLDQLLFATAEAQAGKSTDPNAQVVVGRNAEGVELKARVTPQDSVEETTAQIAALTGDKNAGPVDAAALLAQRIAGVNAESEAAASSAPPAASISQVTAAEKALNYLDLSRPEKSDQPLGPQAEQDPFALEHVFAHLRTSHNAANLNGIADEGVRARATKAVQARFPADTLEKSIAQAREHLSKPLHIGANTKGTLETEDVKQQREGFNPLFDPARPATNPLSVNGTPFTRVLTAFLASHFGVDNNPIIQSVEGGPATVLEALQAIDALPEGRVGSEAGPVNKAIATLLATKLVNETTDAPDAASFGPTNNPARPATVGEALVAAQRGTAVDTATLANLYTQAWSGVEGVAPLATALAGRRITFHGAMDAGVKRLSAGKGLSNTVGRALEMALKQIATGESAPVSDITTLGVNEEGQVHAGTTNLQDAFAPPSQVARNVVSSLVEKIASDLKLAPPTIESGPENLTAAEQEAVVTGRLPSRYIPSRNALFLSSATIDALKGITKTGYRGITAVQNLFHELGHVIYTQTMEWFAQNHPAQMEALKQSHQDTAAGEPFDEWVADQIGNWLIRNMGRKTDGLKLNDVNKRAQPIVARIAAKIKALYRQMLAALGADLDVAPSITEFMRAIQDRVAAGGEVTTVTAEAPAAPTSLETPTDARTAAKKAVGVKIAEDPQRIRGVAPTVEKDVIPSVELSVDKAATEKRLEVEDAKWQAENDRKALHTAKIQARRDAKKAEILARETPAAKAARENKEAARAKAKAEQDQIAKDEAETRIIEEMLAEEARVKASEAKKAKVKQDAAAKAGQRMDLIKRIEARDESIIETILRDMPDDMDSADVFAGLQAARDRLANTTQTLPSILKLMQLTVEAWRQEAYSRAPERAKKEEAAAEKAKEPKPELPEGLLELADGSEQTARMFESVRKWIAKLVAVSGVEAAGKISEIESVIKALAFEPSHVTFLLSTKYYNMLSNLAAKLGPESDITRAWNGTDKAGVNWLEAIHDAVQRQRVLDQQFWSNRREMRLELAATMKKQRKLLRVPHKPGSEGAKDLVKLTQSIKQQEAALKQDMAFDYEYHNDRRSVAATLAIPLYELRHSDDFRNEGIAADRTQSGEVRPDESLGDEQSDDEQPDVTDDEEVSNRFRDANGDGVDGTISQDDLIAASKVHPSVLALESVLSDIEAKEITAEEGDDFLNSFPDLDVAAFEEGGYGEIASEGITEQNLPTLLERLHARIESLFTANDSVRWYTTARGRVNGIFGKQPDLQATDKNGLTYEDALETVSFMRREYPEVAVIIRRSKQIPGRYLVAEKIGGASIGAAIRSAIIAGRNEVNKGKVIAVKVFSRHQNKYVTKPMSAAALMRAIYSEHSDPESYYKDNPLQRFLDAWQMVVGNGLVITQTTDMMGNVIPRYVLTLKEVKGLKPGQTHMTESFESMDGEPVIVGEVFGTPVAMGERKGSINALAADKDATSLMQDKLSRIAKVRNAMDREVALIDGAIASHPGTAAQKLVSLFDFFVSRLRALPVTQRMMAKLDAIEKLQSHEQDLGITLANVLRTHPYRKQGLDVTRKQAVADSNAPVQRLSLAYWEAQGGQPKWDSSKGLARPTRVFREVDVTEQLFLKGYGSIQSAAEALDVAMRQMVELPEETRVEYADTQKSLEELTTQLRTMLAASETRTQEQSGQISLLRGRIESLLQRLHELEITKIKPLGMFGVGESFQGEADKGLSAERSPKYALGHRLWHRADRDTGMKQSIISALQDLGLLDDQEALTEHGLKLQESVAADIDVSVLSPYVMDRILQAAERELTAVLKAQGLQTAVGLDTIESEKFQGEVLGLEDSGTAQEKADAEYANRLIMADTRNETDKATVAPLDAQVRLYSDGTIIERMADLAKRALDHINLPTHIRLVDEAGLAGLLEQVDAELTKLQATKMRIAALPEHPEQSVRLDGLSGRIVALSKYRNQLVKQSASKDSGWIMFSNSAYADLRTPVIFLSDKATGQLEKSRVLAHELGHLVTHQVLDQFPEVKAAIAQELQYGASPKETEELLAEQFVRYLVNEANNDLSATPSPLRQFFAAAYDKLKALWEFLTAQKGLNESYKEFINAVAGLTSVSGLTSTSLYTNVLVEAAEKARGASRDQLATRIDKAGLDFLTRMEQSIKSAQGKLSPYTARRGNNAVGHGFGNAELDNAVGTGARSIGQFVARMNGAALSSQKFGHLVSSIENNVVDIGKVLGGVWTSVITTFGQRVHSLAERGSPSAAYLRDSFTRIYGVKHAEGHRTFSEWERALMGTLGEQFSELQKLTARDNPETTMDKVSWWRGAKGAKQVYGIFEPGNPSPVAEFDTRREAWAKRGELYLQDKKRRSIEKIASQTYRSQVDAVLRQVPLSVLKTRNANGEYDLAIKALETLKSLYDTVTKPVAQGGLDMKLDNFRDRLPMVVDTGELLRSRNAFVTILENSAGLSTEEAEGLVRALLESDGVVLGLDVQIYRDSRNYSAILALLDSAARDPKVMDQLMPFLSQDLPGLVYHYSHALIKRGVADQLYGGESGGRWSPTAKLFGLIDSDQTLSDEERVFMKAKVYPAIMGRLGMATFSPSLRRIYSLLLVYQNLRLLGGATLSSFVDVGVLAARSGGMKTLRSGISMLKASDRPAVLEAIRRLGITSDNITDTVMSDALNSQYLLPGAARFSDSFFRFIGLSQWTNMTRVWATGAGLEVLRELHSMTTGTAGTAAQRTAAARQLQDLQLDPGTLAAWFSNPTATTAELLQSAAIDAQYPAIGAALNQFVDEAILRPSTGDRPGWANYPIAGLIWHLKQFMWLFHERVLNRVLYEMAHTERRGLQRAMPAILLAAFVLPIAAMGYGLRRWLTGDWDKLSKMSEEDLAFELFQRGGLPGIFQIWLDMDESASHKKLALLSALGPTVEQFSSFFTDDFQKWLSRSIPVVSNSGFLRREFNSW